MIPCHCGKKAVVEKQGKSLCAKCKEKVVGREYPIRKGGKASRRELSCSDREAALLKYHYSYGKLTQLFYQ